MKLFDIARTDTVVNNRMSLEEVSASLEFISVSGVLDAVVPQKLKDIYKSLVAVYDNIANSHTAADDKILKDTMASVAGDLKEIRAHKQQETIPTVLNEIGKTIIAVPEGFTGDLGGYIPELTKTSKEVQNLTLKELSNYTDILTNYISNKTYRKTKLNLRSSYSHIAKQLSTLTGKTDTYFTYKFSGSSVMQLSKLVGSYKELLDLESEAHKLSKAIEFKDVMFVDSKVMEASKVLEVFAAEVEADEYSADEMLLELAKYTTEIAELIEVYSLTRFKLELAIKMYYNVTHTLREKLQ